VQRNSASARTSFLHIIFRFDAGIQRAHAQGTNKQSAIQEYAWAALRLTWTSRGLALSKIPLRKSRFCKRPRASKTKIFLERTCCRRRARTFGRSAESKPARTVRRQDAISQDFPKTLEPYQVFSAGPTFGMPVFDLSLWRRYQRRETQ